VEASTGYPAAWFFCAASALVLGLLTLLGGAKLLVDLAGFVYPAYMSFKSMDGNGDDTQWLTYWVVFSAMSLTENILSFVTALIPMYFWLKIAIIVVRQRMSVLGGARFFLAATC
jgi:receptor expression-enhancing protein 5/6